MARKRREGVAVADAAQKTVAVRVERTVMHPLYRKVQRRRKRYLAHDEGNACRNGDRVLIEECRPISKRKSWRVIEILERREVAEIQPTEIGAPVIETPEAPQEPPAVVEAAAPVAAAAEEPAVPEPAAAAAAESGPAAGAVQEPAAPEPAVAEEPAASPEPEDAPVAAAAPAEAEAPDGGANLEGADKAPAAEAPDGGANAEGAAGGGGGQA